MNILPDGVNWTLPATIPAFPFLGQQPQENPSSRSLSQEDRAERGRAQSTGRSSSRTSSKDVQVAIEDSIEKRTKDTFGPPAGKRLICFVDDLNMPKVDTYGTQQPVALLKLLIDKGFLYDRGKDLSIKYMKDMQFIAAMVPARCPYGVDPRFVRLFNVFSIAFPPEESIRRIYATILETFFTANAFDKSMQGNDLASRCTSVMMDVFNAVVAALPPTPEIGRAHV